MIKLAPSLLSADFANLQRDMDEAGELGCEWLHFDVMDGAFVPNISMGIPVLKSVRKATDLILDVHLMVEKPIRYVEQFVKAGADYLTIHVEADTPENTLEALEKIHALGCKAAVSLKPDTPAEAAEPYLKKCDLILVMTVEPGFGGQKFMENMMPKLRSLRTMLDKVNPGCLLEVDGGIDTQTWKICRDNGAEIFVAGSAYFGAPDRAAVVKAIQG